MLLSEVSPMDTLNLSHYKVSRQDSTSKLLQVQGYSPSHSNHQNCCAPFNLSQMTMAQPLSHNCLEYSFQQFSLLPLNSSTKFIIGIKAFPLDPISSPQYPTWLPVAPGHFAHPQILTLQLMTTFPKPTLLTPPHLSPSRKPKSK